MLGTLLGRETKRDKVLLGALKRPYIYNANKNLPRFGERKLSKNG